MKKAYRFGVEIECLVPDGNYRSFLDELAQISRVVIDDDGSLRSEEGYEALEVKIGLVVLIDITR